MDACIAVDREIDKVLSKFGDIRESYSSTLQQLIDDLETVQNDLQKNTNNGKILIEICITFVFGLFLEKFIFVCYLPIFNKCIAWLTMFVITPLHYPVANFIHVILQNFREEVQSLCPSPLVIFIFFYNVSFDVLTHCCLRIHPVFRLILLYYIKTCLFSTQNLFLLFSNYYRHSSYR